MYMYERWLSKNYKLQSVKYVRTEMPQSQITGQSTRGAKRKKRQKHIQRV